MAVLGVFILLTFAVARVARLIASDRILLKLRRWVIRKYGEESLAAYGVVCSWCISIWLAIPAASAWALVMFDWQWWWLAIPGALAMSHLTGLISRLEEQ